MISMNIFSHLIITVYSLLGWNIHFQPPLPIPASSTEAVATSSTPVVIKKEDKPTIARNTNNQLPYLKIVAPEFKQLPVKEIKNSPTQTISQIPVQTPPQQNSPITNNDFVVNIFCTIKSGNTVEYITGSGAIVDSKGAILTNSHVAQYVLLSDYLNNSNRSCVARTGSPAKNTYNIKVMYISSAWIKNNIKTISESAPQGTGQSDYAFLYITGYIDGTAPQSYPSMDLDTTNLNSGDQIKVYGYPAGGANGNYVKNSLVKVSDSTTVSNIYSFTDSPNTDLIIAHSNTIAERGSSGGPIVENGYIEGIITTSLQDNSGSKSFSAITGEYINKDLQDNEGYNLNSLLTGDLKQKSTSFEASTGFSLAKDLISNNP